MLARNKSNRRPNISRRCVATLLLVACLGIIVYADPGDLDPTFGIGGKLIDWSDRAVGVAIQSDGKIVVVGLDSNLGSSDFEVARYLPNGLSDLTFGGGTGRVTTDFGGRDKSMSVAIQADGKIVVAGVVFGPVTGGLAIARYSPDGSLDTSFGGGTGKVLTPSCWEYTYGGTADMAILPDGKIIGVVGFADWDDNCAEHDGLIARYLSDGTLDATFGDGDGLVPTSYDFWDVAVQSDGKLVVSGSNQLARFHANGSPDTGFGSAGVVSIPFGYWMRSITLNAEGKIVASGSVYQSSGDYYFGLYRFNTNGTPDTSFDGDGIVTRLDLLPGSSVVVQPDGKILAAGASLNGSYNDFALARFNPNGSPDTEFGGGEGLATVDFGGDDSPYHLTLDNHGRAVVVGSSNGSFAIARVLLGPRRTVADFDGDGRADVSVFRPSDSVWYLDRSRDGFAAIHFGLPTDKIVPADYDGDGISDIAVYRDGTWWQINSSSNTSSAVQFGLPDDLPVPADFTGDGRDEIALLRDGQWWTLDISNGQSSLVNFGLPGDKPVPADYDGDGRFDQAVYRNGEWHLNRSSQGYAVLSFGLPTDLPVTGDYDGDGKGDVAVYRDGTWYVQQSTQGFSAFQFGSPDDIPVPADYDGDGKTDAAVYRNGTWYVLKTTGGVSIQQFGLIHDRPVPAASSSGSGVLIAGFGVPVDTPVPQLYIR